MPVATAGKKLVQIATQTDVAVSMQRYLLDLTTKLVAARNLAHSAQSMEHCISLKQK